MANAKIANSKTRIMHSGMMILSSVSSNGGPTLLSFTKSTVQLPLVASPNAILPSSQIAENNRIKTKQNKTYSSVQGLRKPHFYF